MRVAMISALPVFLVVLLAMGYESAIPAFTIESAAVDIYNYVEQPIQVHCDNEDQTLENGQKLGWRFSPLRWGTTKYTCSFRWGARTTEYLVWVDSGLFGSGAKRPCTHCVWRVTKMGFYRSELGELTAVPIHDWP